MRARNHTHTNFWMSNIRMSRRRPLAFTAGRFRVIFTHGSLEIITACEFYRVWVGAEGENR